MLSSTKTLATFPSQIHPCANFQHRSQLVVTRISNDNGNNNIASGNDLNNAASQPVDAVEIRFKRGSRQRRRRQQDDVGTADKMSKDWDSMSLSDKAVELYMGEKGLLFWLNKLAYASIFIVIGGWILFRFVGPALNLYQLDTPPLSPTSMFNGS